LNELSRGALREDTEFLFEGMSEILVNEFTHSSKSLEAAWTVSRFLDSMQMLSLKTQRAWTAFAGGTRCFRNSAPGVTFLTTFRELQDRERPIKLFEALAKTSLTKSLELTFKAPIAELEKTWLKGVREYRVIDEITIAAEEVPELRSTLLPETVRPGDIMQMRLFFKDPVGNLLPEGVFIQDERTRHVFQGKAGSTKDAGDIVVDLPIAGDCPAGEYNYQVTAIDESGNLRIWSGRYNVISR
jgi:hypothetical protein